MSDLEMIESLVKTIGVQQQGLQSVLEAIKILTERVTMLELARGQIW